MGGGGLTQSIKSLTEKGNENPYFQYREGGSRKFAVFPPSVSFYHLMAPLREPVCKFFFDEDWAPDNTPVCVFRFFFPFLNKDSCVDVGSVRMDCSATGL